MASKKVVVAGATGLVGNAALRHFEHVAGIEVVALSRRKPRELYGARHLPIDLADAESCANAAQALSGATHLIFAALYEAPNLIDGWRDPGQIAINAKDYGSSPGFTIAYTAGGADGSAQLGLAAGTVHGLDVQGTIGGNVGNGSGGGAGTASGAGAGGAISGAGSATGAPASPHSGSWTVGVDGRGESN